MLVQDIGGSEFTMENIYSRTRFCTMDLQRGCRNRSFHEPDVPGTATSRKYRHA